MTDKVSAEKQISNSRYDTYLLRVWQEDVGEDWRVTLKDVRDGEQLSFASLALLIDFIQNRDAG